ncbi:hypothetical protein IX317_002152 [Fusobacterium sp. DD29]|uniref:hypothetical protein n=1 Tax=unclassified Fusobacterium TaxID=2648384 RepID=UPI001B8C50D9|nr:MULTISPECIES: hypothetical protein [unclassified Fusobacterium]MBR8701167.1 hypothetical protein [Fusobacterium sp. DD45]MBR8711320.1 hypothetical protein [Fusobacterium sp. DD28]MBR8750430.1 hypothetical protein [Fusobacterium sp. DD29]MBR8751869.1 hypothetical protein [Fusobacterium sp. DD26]MBR8762668.1 hypothetical protein [Fusobacterium sp. DD25]
MEFIFDFSEKKDYKFTPNLYEEIEQNIENAINRIKGNVVLARQKGIDYNIIDKPDNIKIAQLTADVVEEIEREEPRFSIKKILIENSSPSNIILKIKGDINV